MYFPSTPVDETKRLDELRLLEILDTLPEDDYDAITSLASELCSTPVALISFVDKDRQWFKSKVGIEFCETSRDISFCAHAINEPGEIFEITDAKEDIRFSDNPLVTMKNGIRFYAGIPLVTESDNALGTLCVIDTEPKTLNQRQRNALTVLARNVINSLELRKKNKLISIQNKDLLRKNDLLRNFAKVVSHDLKSPLNNIIGLSNILCESDAPSAQITKKFGSLIGDSAHNLKELIDDLLKYSALDVHSYQKKVEISMEKIVKECQTHYIGNSKIQIFIADNTPTLYGHEILWKQIIYNLISNAIKHNDKDEIRIWVFAEIRDDKYILAVQDNGPGISEELKNKIFDPMVSLANHRNGVVKTSGMGLAHVTKVVKSMGGEIKLESHDSVGSVFKVMTPYTEIPKSGDRSSENKAAVYT
jgi:K+-sensing histidine kinase KdpD